MPRFITPIPSRLHAQNDFTDVNRDDRGEGLKTAAGLSDSDVGTIKATGYIRFSGIPVNGETLTVNGAVFNFLDTPLDPTTDFDIKTTAATQATEVASVLNASVDPLVSVATYTPSGGDVLIQFDVAGTDGNDFTLAESATNTAVSGATLSGGVDYNAYESVIKNFMHG